MCEGYPACLLDGITQPAPTGIGRQQNMAPNCPVRVVSKKCPLVTLDFQPLVKEKSMAQRRPILFEGMEHCVGTEPSTACLLDIRETSIARDQVA